MEYGTVSAEGMAALIIMVVVGFAMPIAVSIFWTVKKKVSYLPVAIGAIMFVVFALGLESIPKYFLLLNGSNLANYIMGHFWSFALVGAGLAGIFEETARFLAFRIILRKHDKKETAISYGIGHGGIEAIVLLGISGISYLMYAVMMNTGTFDVMVQQIAMTAPDQVEAMGQLAQALQEVTLGNGFLSILERIMAMIFHVSCSVLVFKAVHDKGAWYFYPIAILLHMFLDVFAAMFQFGIITSIYVVEACIAALSIIVAIFAKRVYDKMNL